MPLLLVAILLSHVALSSPRIHPGSGHESVWGSPAKTPPCHRDKFGFIELLNPVSELNATFLMALGATREKPK